MNSASCIESMFCVGIFDLHWFAVCSIGQTHSYTCISMVLQEKGPYLLLFVA